MAAIATRGAGGLDDVAEAVLVPNGTIVTRMKEMDRGASWTSRSSSMS